MTCDIYNNDTAILTSYTHTANKHKMNIRQQIQCVCQMCLLKIVLRPHIANAANKSLNE